MKVAEFESLSVVFSSERVTNSTAAGHHDAYPTVLFFSHIGWRKRPIDKENPVAWRLAGGERGGSRLAPLRRGPVLPPEAAKTLGVSLRTDERLCTFARACLRARVRGAGWDDNPS